MNFHHLLLSYTMKKCLNIWTHCLTRFLVAFIILDQ